MKLPTLFLWIALLGCAGCGSLPASTKNAQGVQLFQRARYAEARTLFEQAVLAEPAHADARYNLAVACHKLGVLYRNPTDLARAEHEYNLCLDFNPNHADCYRGLTVLLVETGRGDAAVRLLTGWRGRNPLSAEPPLQLARLYDEAGQPRMALDYLLQANALAPSDPRVYTAMGYLRERQGDLQQAMYNYQQSLAYRPKQPDIAHRVAALQARLATETQLARIPATTSDPAVVASTLGGAYPPSQPGVAGVIAPGSTTPLRVGPPAPIGYQQPSYERTVTTNRLGSRRF